MKAAFLDYGTMGPDLDLTGLSSLVDELRVFDATEDDQLAERINGTDLVFTNKMRFNAEVLTAAPNLRYIGLTATGSDNIDLDGARRAGVTVANIRAYCTDSVAEHVFGVLLMLARRLHVYARFVRDGGWQDADNFCPLEWPVTSLRGRTLGIVGFGELGQGVARLAEAFGMRVQVAARPGSDTVPDDRVSLDALLESSDIVSLHCPLNDVTRGLINAESLARMPTHALLVNTARGGLVDSAALKAALEDGRIAGAAVDVLPVEPPVNGDPLLDYDGDNLLVTPHIAWAATDARQAAIDQLADNARAFLEGRPQNVLT